MSLPSLATSCILRTIATAATLTSAFHACALTVKLFREGGTEEGEGRTRGGRSRTGSLAATDHHGRVCREVMQVLQAWREAKRVAQQRAGDGIAGGDTRGARPLEVATSSRADFARQLLPPIAPPPQAPGTCKTPLFDIAL